MPRYEFEIRCKITFDANDADQAKQLLEDYIEDPDLELIGITEVPNGKMES